MVEIDGMTIVDWRAAGCGVAKDYGNVANGKKERSLLAVLSDLCILHYGRTHTLNTEHNVAKEN